MKSAPKKAVSFSHTRPLDVVLFIGPVLLGLLLFNYLPMLMSFLLGFCHWNLLGSITWVGFENYFAIFNDPLFWKTLFNTLTFVTFSVILELLISLTIAFAVDQLTRGKRFFESLFFLPVVTPMVAFSLVWQWMLDPNSGALNQVIDFLGGQPIAFLYEPTWAMAALITLKVWKEMGLSILLFVTALKNIPAELKEAALLDGATGLRQFQSVLLPMLTPIIFFVVSMGLINGFQVFDSVYLLTQGGPENSTQVLVYWVFKNAFGFYKVGQASAIAYVLFVIIAVLTLIQWQLRKRWVLGENS